MFTFFKAFCLHFFSCYSTQAGITTCSTSTITGRKKRSENPENVIRTQSTKVMLNDVEHDFAELIQATRVSVLISYPNLSLDGKKIEKDIFSCNFYRLLDTLKMNI